MSSKQESQLSDIKVLDNNNLNEFYNDIFLNQKQYIILNIYPEKFNHKINKGFFLSLKEPQSFTTFFSTTIGNNSKNIKKLDDFEYKDKIKGNKTIRVVRHLNEFENKNNKSRYGTFFLIHIFETKEQQPLFRNQKPDLKQKNIIKLKQSNLNNIFNKLKQNSSSLYISQKNQSSNTQVQQNQDLKINKPQNNQSTPKNDQRIQIENKLISEQQKQPQQLDFEESKINLDNIQPKLEHIELEHLQLDIYQKHEILKAQMKKKDEEMKQKEDQNQRLIIQNLIQNLEKNKKQVELEEQHLQQMINKYNHQKNHEQPENGYIEEKPYQL